MAYGTTSSEFWENFSQLKLPCFFLLKIFHLIFSVLFYPLLFLLNNKSTMLCILEARKKVADANRNLTNCNTIYQNIRRNSQNRYRPYGERKRFQYFELRAFHCFIELRRPPLPRLFDALFPPFFGMEEGEETM